MTPPKKRIDGKAINIPRDKLNDIEFTKKEFQEFLKNERMFVLESTRMPTKSRQNMIDNMKHILDKYPKTMFVFTGDQPVYDEERKYVEKNDELWKRVFASFPGKFHVKQVTLRAINELFYDNLIDSMKSKFTPKKKKNLKNIPQGYFKMSEKLFVNVFFSLWKAFYRFFTYTNSKLSVKLTFNEFREKKATSRFNGYLLSELDDFCTNYRFSYFLLLKSIKTDNFDLYVVFLKMFLNYSLSTGENVKVIKNKPTNSSSSDSTTTKNVSHYNYFRIITLHLFDITYSYNDEVLKFLKQNFTYNFNLNHISFDEMTEIMNKEIKCGAKAADPVKYLQKISSLNSLIKFFRRINKKIINYSKKMEIDEITSSTFPYFSNKDSIFSKFNKNFNLPTEIKKKCILVLKNEKLI